ncbi:MAG: right-handed parallel beta-helix repeat-containing protein, partial [Thermoplasmata archaeon]|nr:right-handed parallel beta-helix repeat-containing protein [Thermoplasmata archaeon]
PYDEEKWVYYYDYNIRLLKNKDRLPVVLTSGARLGQFNQSRECFNWAFVSSRGGGAVASIGSTGLCWIGHGKNSTEFYLGNLHLRLFKEYHETDVLGAMVGDAIASYLSAFNTYHHGISESFHIKAAEELELFGDPTLAMGGNAGGSLPAGVTDGRTLYVGGSGAGNYTTIQDAVNDAADGDTVFVYNGTYHEEVKVDKSIRLVGQDERGTVLVSDGNGIIANADGVTIGHMSVGSGGSGKNYAGILCRGVGCTVGNATVSGYDWGIYLENASGCIVENSRLMKNNEYAIYMTHSPGAIVSGNAVDGNWYGVWSEYSPSLTVEENNFSNNRWYALWMDNSGGSMVSGNTFFMNWYSIYLYSSGNNTVYGNEIRRNEHGPQFVDADDNMFGNNDVERNEHYGISVGKRSSGNSFTNNNIMDNAQNAWDDHGSTWDGNYWSDYIGLKIKLFGLIGLPYHVPGNINQWDMHPRTEPLN